MQMSNENYMNTGELAKNNAKGNSKHTMRKVSRTE